MYVSAKSIREGISNSSALRSSSSVADMNSVLRPVSEDPFLCLMLTPQVQEAAQSST